MNGWPRENWNFIRIVAACLLFCTNNFYFNPPRSNAAGNTAYVRASEPSPAEIERVNREFSRAVDHHMKGVYGLSGVLGE